jgi:outer membrane protein OmpA-like peptidoglycan-associated protein
MKFKNVFLAALLFMGAAAVQAQEEGAEYEFQKHAFLNVEAGAQHTLGEAKFKDLMSPNVQLGLGYQFSPVLAARLQANAWQSKGGWSNFRKNAGDPPYTGKYKFNYVAPGVDVMVNLSNLICGWNPKRVFNVTAFVGGGANIAWGNDEVNDIAKTLKSLDNYDLQNLWDGSKVNLFGRGGVELGFRLSDAVSLLVEGNANILSDKYNSKKADNADWYFNGLVGVRVNLGKSYRKIEKVVEEPVAEPEPVIEVAPVVEEKKPVVVEKQPVTPKVGKIQRDVTFELNKAVVRSSEMNKIKEVADYMKKYPKSKVSVIGYADAGTGNDRINDKLAAQRADAVVKVLREQYGISDDRIEYDSKGSRVQPYQVNDMNRVCICIAE